MRKALSEVAALGLDRFYAFGTQEDTKPIDHLIGTAAGWVGCHAPLPFYIMDSVIAYNGATPHVVSAQNVPVNAFWSITVYNKDGYLDANDMSVNGYNNFTASPDEDGGHTIHFGGCADGRINCDPTTDGWKSAIRMYEPAPKVLYGSWTFPEIQAMQ